MGSFCLINLQLNLSHGRKVSAPTQPFDGKRELCGKTGGNQISHVLFDRYLELVHPMWHMKHFRKCWVYLMILFSWTFGYGYHISTSIFINNVCVPPAMHYFLPFFFYTWLNLPRCPDSSMLPNEKNNREFQHQKRKRKRKLNLYLRLETTLETLTFAINLAHFPLLKSPTITPDQAWFLITKLCKKMYCTQKVSWVEAWHERSKS